MSRRAVVLGLVGAPVVLFLALLAGPALFDWSRLVPRFAEAVRTATGWTLRVDGPVTVRLVPDVTITAGGLRLASPGAFERADLASAAALSARVDLVSLLRGAIVVEALTVDGLTLDLQVNADGEPNWVPASDARAPAGPRASRSLPPVTLESVEVMGATVAYRDAVRGQRLLGEGVELAAAAPAPGDPLAVRARGLLNGDRVELTARVDPLQALLERRPAEVEVALESRHVIARLEAALQIEPLVGLDGAAALDVPSVGALARWLDLPLETDPGPLRGRARFRSDGLKVALEEATIEGEYLSVRASGSFEQVGGELHVTGHLDAPRLDLDRYFPPGVMPTPRDRRMTAAELHAAYLAAFPDTPIDLDALRALVADVRVTLDGVALHGLELSPLRVRARSHGGVLEAEVEELGLYGGAVQARLRVDATREAIDARAELGVDGVDSEALVAALTGGEAPVTGMARAHLAARSGGRTLRDVMRDVTGTLEVALESDARIEGAEQLSEVALSVERPGTDTGLRAVGEATYDGERVAFTLTCDPLDTVLAGEPITLDATLESAVLDARYAGTVYQRPAPSLAGALDAKTPSLDRLARWLGLRWKATAQGRGSLALNAIFASDGRRGRIERARLRGEGIDLAAAGRFDLERGVTRYDLAVTGATLLLDRYLALADARAHSLDAYLDSLPDQPIDAAFLRAHAGSVRFSLDRVRSGALELGQVDVAAQLADGVLDVQGARIDTPAGVASGTLRVDASARTPRMIAEATIDEFDPEWLAGTLAGAGVPGNATASASVTLSSSGPSVRGLANAAAATVSLRLPELTLRQGPFLRIADVEATARLARLTDRPRVGLRGTLFPRGDRPPVPLELEGTIGPIDALTGAAPPVELDATARIGRATLAAVGRTTRAETLLDLRLESPTVGDLWFGTRPASPEVGPVAIAGTLRAAPERVEVTRLDARVGRSDLAGEISVALGAERPRVTATARSRRIDLHELAPFDSDRGAADMEKTASRGPRQVFSEEPLPLARLKAIEGELQLEIAKLLLPTGAEVDDIDTHLAVDAGVLHVGPAEGTHAGGRTSLSLTVDAGEAPPRFDLLLEAKRTPLDTFVPSVRSTARSEGRADVDLRLSAVGKTPRAVASSLTGTVRLVGEGGALDSRMLDVLAFDVFDLLGPFLSRQGRNEMNCFVVGLDFEEGVGTSRAMLIDLAKLSIAGGGRVDIRTETLDLHFETNSKVPSIATIAVPFDVVGPLAAPAVRAHRTRALVRGAATWFSPAVVFGALATIGAARNMSENPCVTALREAETGEPEAASEHRRHGRGPLRWLFGGG